MVAGKKSLAQRSSAGLSPATQGELQAPPCVCRVGRYAYLPIPHLGIGVRPVS